MIVCVHPATEPEDLSHHPSGESPSDGRWRIVVGCRTHPPRSQLPGCRDERDQAQAAGRTGRKISPWNKGRPVRSLLLLLSVNHALLAISGKSPRIDVSRWTTTDHSQIGRASCRERV